MTDERIEDRLSRLRQQLRSRPQFVADGLTEARLRARVSRGEILRILQGRYILAADWEKLDRDEQHLLRMLAVERGAHRPPLFSHYSAALLHRLPLLNFARAQVHVLAPNTPSTTSRRRKAGTGSPASARAEVIRHNRTSAADRVARTGDLMHTDLVSTVVDIARAAPLAAGLVCADAGLRRLVMDEGMPQDAARSRLLDHLTGTRGTPGNDRARRVIGFASAFAESPLESLTRLQLARLGFETREQVPISAPEGGQYRLDFELVGQACFLEADGKVKYTDERMLDGRSASEVVYREKRRDNLVSGVTRKAVLHLGWAEAQSPHALSALLRDFGLTPPNPSGLARPDLY